MTVSVDFAGPHRRHWSDAEFLFTSERLRNNDQLHGLSAGCGLKAVTERSEMPVPPSGCLLAELG